MSRRFLVLCWTSPHGEARADRVVRRCGSGMVQIHRDASSRIVALPDEAIRIGRSLLLGELVHVAHADRIAAAPDASHAARLLVANAWGRYVAILYGPEGIGLLADPSGAGRAHLCGDRELSIVSDILDPATLRSAGLDPDIDAEALAGGLVDPTTLIVGSALRGVRCLPPGTLVHMDGGIGDEILWSPRTVRDHRDGRPMLIEAVEAAVNGLRGAHPLVQVSGGFDSAVVLATAAAVGPATAFTVTSAAGDVAEAAYAREAADASGSAIAIGTDEDLPGLWHFVDAPQSASPFLHGLDEIFDRQMQRAVLLCGCDRVLTGQGGDAVFLQPSSHSTTIDRFADLGLSGLLAGLADDARRGRTSIWQPLRALLHHLLRGTDQPASPPLTPHLLTRDALAGSRGVAHPWTIGRDERRPGRDLQARLLANATVVHTARPRPPSVPIVHPLLAQPVLEAVLTLPTWALASGSHDRGLARRSFGPRIPPSIAGRFVKGQASAYFSRAVVERLPELRERLLDGRLVRMSILDRAALETVLTREHLAHSADYRSLMFLATCEAWAAAWT